MADVAKKLAVLLDTVPAAQLNINAEKIKALYDDLLVIRSADKPPATEEEHAYVNKTARELLSALNTTRAGALTRQVARDAVNHWYLRDYFDWPDTILEYPDLFNAPGGVCARDPSFDALAVKLDAINCGFHGSSGELVKQKIRDFIKSTGAKLFCEVMRRYPKTTSNIHLALTGRVDEFKDIVFTKAYITAHAQWLLECEGNLRSLMHAHWQTSDYDEAAGAGCEVAFCSTNDDITCTVETDDWVSEYAIVISGNGDSASVPTVHAFTK